MTDEMTADLQGVLMSRLRAEEKILWIRLYLMAKYRAFAASQIDVAEVLGMKRYTFRKHIYALKNEGALTIKRKYNNGDTRGCFGATYQLVPVEFWTESGISKA